MSTIQKLELTWVDKNKDLKLEPRILIENKELSNNGENSDNMIIHGDNLLALKALEKTHAGMVKCIYIDPPYNTGKAFDHYDDNVEHSIWLNLISQRIKLLKKLLANDGFFCCHIDDSESHYLKVLCDEVFGRQNYLSSLYVQVRYPNKTLAEDSDYQKVIEQVLVYAKDKTKAKVNRPQAEYEIDKFCWKITEKTSGETIRLGNKDVTIFKDGEYEVEKVEPSFVGLKETWATGSLSRVSGSAGEFFELNLASRKEVDGLGTLYKVSNIGEDGLGYRYISGPKKATANKGKFYSGIPLKRLEELKNGKSFKFLPISNFYDFAGSFGNCRLEGSVDFKGGKKPEKFLKTILEYFSNENDLVLDSFLGSGSTAATAHKMNRKFIGIEMGEQAYTHCKSRIDKIISNQDNTGISKDVNWKGGGGYKFYELAPTLVNIDDFGQEVINPTYNPDQLAAAVALHEGYKYNPNPETFWKQSTNGDISYLYVTTNHITLDYYTKISMELKEDEYLIIACKSFDAELTKRQKNIHIKKIPNSLLKNCEFDKENYNLNIVNPPIYDEEDDCDE